MDRWRAKYTAWEASFRAQRFERRLELEIASGRVPDVKRHGDIWLHAFALEALITTL